MQTPVKTVKRQAETLKQWDLVANDLFSYTDSRARQPVEALFNWINGRTDIQ